ncbi:MAG: redoxin domain-containing protein [Bacteroidales bacterium]|nr:redoxin domain-containing protein [Bacteroidales bacterium]
MSSVFKNDFLVAAMVLLTVVSCKNSSIDCVVKGTVQGVKDGAELVLLDEWNNWKAISTTTVENGVFEFHPRISAPTHVYLYASDPEDVFANPYDGGQLKDFFLDPGTILVDVRAEDELDMGTGATGTALNDAFHQILTADPDARETLWEAAIRDERTNLLALVHADAFPDDLDRAEEILGHLSPDQAKTYKKYISTLKKNLVRKAERAERRKQAAEEEVSLVGQHYIDMEYPNVDDIPVRLSAVVDNPETRYVILDFWATWCLNCVKSLPTLKEVYAKYHDKGLVIFSISQDSKANEWKAFVEKNEMTWINVLASSDSKVYKDYCIEFIPKVFLIDCRTGEILVHEGHPDLDAVLSGLLP